MPPESSTNYWQQVTGPHSHTQGAGEVRGAGGRSYCYLIKLLQYMQKISSKHCLEPNKNPVYGSLVRENPNFLVKLVLQVIKLTINTHLYLKCLRFIFACYEV